MSYEHKIIPLSELRPYDKNPRKHSNPQLKEIINSINEFGFTNPLIVDEETMILAGHGRFEAAEKLKLKEIPCIIVNGLSDTQKRAYVIADNKLTLNGEWDNKLLIEELNILKDVEFDISLTGFGQSEIDSLLELVNKSNGLSSIYTKKIEAPTYTPGKKKPKLKDLIDTSKTDVLIEEINATELPKDEKQFLIQAAYRHTVFNFERIADYYANSDKTTQELMENSALVLIDFNKAIENGYVTLSKNLEELFANDYKESEDEA